MLAAVKLFVLKICLIGFVPYCIYTLLSLGLISYGATYIDYVDKYTPSIIAICAALLILTANCMVCVIFLKVRIQKKQTTDIEMQAKK